ncbi:dihydroorotase [Baaleninema sp.]|uniref:dihydroorotase n=1 Tax=Baaleninema sp. TaxID=3101197 RepID=UPI003D0124C2
MAAKEVLRQVRTIDPVSNGDRVADVWLENGTVRAVVDRLEEIPTEAVEIDGRGLILGPGLVDLYGRTGEPGFEERDTLESLAKSAVAGGYTRVTLLPKAVPPIDNPAGVAQLRSLWGKLGSIDPAFHPPQLLLWGALTRNLEGDRMTELADLAEAGVVGFTDGSPLSNPVFLRRVLEYSQGLGRPLGFYPCDRRLAGDGVAREGVDSLRLGLPGVPAMAETAALTALLEEVAEFETPVHVMRVSTARSVEILAEAKSRGLPVTASTPWTHLIWDTTDLAEYDTNLRLDPPLGTPGDREALVEGVKSGVLDAIAVDRAPYTYEEKTVAFAEAPGGAIGLQYSFVLLWNQLVTSGRWTPLELWRAMSANPARCLHQTPPSLQVGESAELLLFDPHASETLSKREILSRSSNAPGLGTQVSGRILRTWC